MNEFYFINEISLKCINRTMRNVKKNKNVGKCTSKYLIDARMVTDLYSNGRKSLGVSEQPSILCLKLDNRLNLCS